jgi:hypothetical protein
MKFSSSFKFAALWLFILFSCNAKAQQSLHQIIVVSGGAFSNPNDFVSLSAYNPSTSSQNSFGEIQTQAVQHVIIDGNKLYVTATDSIVVFDLNTYQKLNAIAISGPRRMLIAEDLLYVSIQYPETQKFVRIYNKHNLNLISEIQEISGETAGMLKHEDKIYVAVPGDWTSTSGKIAVLNAVNGGFIEEIDFSSQGIGIHDLFIYNGDVVTVNRSPWGSDSGFLTFFNPITKQVVHHSFPHSFGKGIAIHGNLLYLVMDNGIGSINLDSRQVVNPSIVTDPGSASYIYFADVVFDDLAALFYSTTTDYFSFGAGHIFDLSGNQIAGFSAGISPEALALDYRSLTGLTVQKKKIVSVFPNPATEKIRIESEKSEQIRELLISSTSGQVLLSKWVSRKQNDVEIDISKLLSGFYFVNIIFDNGSQSIIKFVKQ